MSALSTTKMTARQFLLLGEDPPGVRLELVNGEIEVTPSPMPGHSRVDRALTILLGSYIRSHDLGELFGDVDTLFGEHDVRRPDLLFFSKDRLHLIGEKAMEGPPDLAIEVISPSSVRTDRQRKFHLYEKSGVAHYWIVDPQKRTLEGFSLIEGRYQATVTGRDRDVIRVPPFPDLDIPLGELWWRR